MVILWSIDDQMEADKKNYSWQLLWTSMRKKILLNGIEYPLDI